jgi:hypothetical protein
VDDYALIVASLVRQHLPRVASASLELPASVACGILFLYTLWGALNPLMVYLPIFWLAEMAHPSHRSEDFRRDSTLVRFETQVWRWSSYATCVCMVAGCALSTWYAIERFRFSQYWEGVGLLTSLLSTASIGIAGIWWVRRQRGKNRKANN